MPLESVKLCDLCTTATFWLHVSSKIKFFFYRFTCQIICELPDHPIITSSIEFKLFTFNVSYITAACYQMKCRQRALFFFWTADGQRKTFDIIEHVKLYAIVRYIQQVIVVQIQMIDQCYSQDRNASHFLSDVLKKVKFEFFATFLHSFTS